MVTQQRLLEVFVELADTMVDEFDVIDLMHTLTETAVELIAVDAAGLMLADQRGNLQVITATSDATRDLETFELEQQEGPCIECFRTGRSVVNVAPADARLRWPEFERVATVAGFVSVHSVPMRLRDNVIGAMNLYQSRSGPLSTTDIALARGLADMATIGLLQERAVQEQALVAEQLQGALNSRVIIEQAKGVLAERASVNPDQAFDLMRRYARSGRQPLAGVARNVIDGTLTLQP